MTDTITVSAGAQVEIEPGVYQVTLTGISEPRTIYPQTGPNAGKEVLLRDWTFALEDGTEIRAGASTASGPKSKTYAWLTALLGGTPPAIGTSYGTDTLVGRMALATVSLDEGGWPRITNLSALPRATRTAPVAPTNGEAVVKPRRAAPNPDPVVNTPNGATTVSAAAADDDLPF